MSENWFDKAEWQNGRGRKKKRKIDELGGVSNKRVQCSDKKKVADKNWKILWLTWVSQIDKRAKSDSAEVEVNKKEFTKLTYCAHCDEHLVLNVFTEVIITINHSLSDVDNHSLPKRTVFLFLIQFFWDFLYIWCWSLQIQCL